MKDVEVEIGMVEVKNEELEGRVKEVEEKLKGVIEVGEVVWKIGLEEEMMMMVVVYEVVV